MATFYLNHEAELYHYGVKGMKWGNHVYADPTTWGKHKYAKKASAKKSINKALTGVGKLVKPEDEEEVLSVQELIDAFKKGQENKKKKITSIDEAINAFKKGQDERRRKAAERAHRNAVDARHRAVDAQNRVLAEQEKARRRRKEKENLQYKKNRSYTTQYRR